MRGLLVTVLVTGCGRVAFDDRPLVDAAVAIDASDPSLLAYYGCEDALGDGVADLTGRGHDGQCVNGCPTTVPGIVGSACHFDGGPMVRVTSTPDLTMNPVTIAAWVRRQASGANQNVVSKVLGTQYDNSWQLVLDNTDRLTYCVTDAGPGTCGATPATVPSDTWMHVAFVATTTGFTAYLDGVPFNSDMIAPIYDDRPLVFGGDIDLDTPANKLTGDIDEIRIYDRALTTPEIAALATP